MTNAIEILIDLIGITAFCAVVYFGGAWLQGAL